MNIADASGHRKQGGAGSPTEVSPWTLSPSIPAAGSAGHSQKCGCSPEGGAVRPFFGLAPGHAPPVLAAGVVMAFGRVVVPLIPAASLRLPHSPP